MSKSIFTAKCWKISLITVFMMVILWFIPVSHAIPVDDAVLYGKGCHFCFSDYVEIIQEKMDDIGINDIEVHYLIDNETAEAELNNIREEFGVPLEMQSNIASIYYGRYLFEGAISPEIIADFLVNHSEQVETLVVYLDKLNGVYVLINETGGISECNAITSLSECWNETDVQSEDILAVVLLSGLLDGINPCAFSVLLFFVGLLLNTGVENKNRLITIGLTYIASIYVAYLTIGLSLYQIISMTNYLDWVASIGALLMILLGIVNIYDYLGGKGFSLKIPFSGLMVIYDWMKKLTVPATVIAGFMVAIFEFPCTGGVYFGIIGMLASETMQIEGFFYLILYNLAFIAPLLVLFSLVFIGKLQNYSLGAAGHRRLKLFSGAVFVILGLYLLLT